MKTVLTKNKKKKTIKFSKTPYFLYVVGVQIIVHQMFPPLLWAGSTFTHGCWSLPCDTLCPRRLFVKKTLLVQFDSAIKSSYLP